MSQRIRPTQQLLRELTEFYGQSVCVVEDGEQEVQWHHLDENSSNTKFPNLVPISANLNQAIELRRRTGKRRRNEQWDPVRLLAVSRSEIYRNEYRRAYGCSRLGSFLAATERYYDASIAHASRAIRASRPLGRLDLAADTLTRNVLPIAKSERLARQVDHVRSARLLDEVGLALFEYHSLDACIPFLSLAQRFLERVARRDIEWALTQCQTEKHLSFAHLERGEFSSAHRLMDSVLERADEFDITQRVADSPVRLLWGLRCGVHGSADPVSLLEQIVAFKHLSKRSLRVAPVRLTRPEHRKEFTWLLAGARLIEAEAELRRGDESRAVDIVVEVGDAIADDMFATRSTLALPVMGLYRRRNPSDDRLVPPPTAVAPFVKVANRYRRVAQHVLSNRESHR